MMKQNIKRIHGHSLEELSDLLFHSSDILEGGVSLDPISLGGWSNLNIHGHDSNIEFVLKLPWSTENNKTNPYAHLFKIGQFISKSGISPVPLDLGHLNDSKETPFILFEFVDGNVYNSLVDLSSVQVQSLKRSLRILTQLNPPNIPLYNSPSEYLIKIQKSVENHEWLPRGSEEVTRMEQSFSSLYSDLLSTTDSYGEWSKLTMHGDLWVPNIVFRKQRAVLLDLEECAIGDPLYDIAYLLEASYKQEMEHNQHLVNPKIRDAVNLLRPLALSYVVVWSIERLLSMESGIVEPSINTPFIRNEILSYAKMKLARLHSFLIN